MSHVFLKRTAIVIVICGAVLFVALAAVTVPYQSYKVGKIDFVITDNQRENVTGLSREQLIDFLQRCGARVDSSSPEWTVRYDGIFQHRDWTFRFVPPPKTPPH